MAHLSLALEGMEGEGDFWLVNDPGLIREVLVTREADFSPTFIYEVFPRVFGRGLLVSEGPRYVRARRVVQPAFHRRQLAGWADRIVRAVGEQTAAWRAGEAFDLVAGLKAVSRRVVARLVFGVAGDDDPEVAALGPTLAELEESATRWRLPAGEEADFEAARQRLDAVLYRHIVARRAAPPAAEGGVLSLLLAAAGEEDEADGDEQVRDELASVLVAGSETTALALGWTFHLLMENPGVAEQLAGEVRGVLGADRPATFADLPALEFVRQVFTEGLRLYPPAWFIGRRARSAGTLGGYGMAAGTRVILSPLVTQRDARWFPDPGSFRPERWTEAARAERPRFSFFPFAAGSRQCVGEGFANLQGILTLATVLRDWRLRPAVAGAPPPRWAPRVTLQFRDGLPVVAERRW